MTGPRRPRLLAISGPQGSGKTTESARRAPPARVLSTDDFYAAYEAQPARRAAALAAFDALLAEPDAGCVPGGAGEALAARWRAEKAEGAALRALAAAMVAGRNLFVTDAGAWNAFWADVFPSLASRGPVSLPRYDKALRGGHGDRSAATAAPPHDGLWVIEGWWVGYQVVPPAAIAAAYARSAPGLPPLHIWAWMARFLDGLARPPADEWLVLVPPDVDTVLAWRWEQEVTRGQGLSRDEVVAMVDRFRPWYAAYLDRLPAAVRALGRPVEVRTLDARRQVVATQRD